MPTNSTIGRCDNASNSLASNLKISKEKNVRFRSSLPFNFSCWFCLLIGSLWNEVGIFPETKFVSMEKI